MQQLLDRTRRRAAVLLAVVAGLVASADFLFYRQPVGWTLGLYLALLMLGVGVRGVSAAPRAAAGIAAMLAGLAGALALQPGPLPIVLGVVGVVALALVGRCGWTASVRAWGLRLVGFLGYVGGQPILDAAVASRRRKRRPVGRRGAGLASLGQWVVPVALSLVFVGLFWLANPLIGEWLGRVSEWFARFAEDWSDVFAAGRVALWVIVGLCAWALLRARVRVHVSAEVGGPASAAAGALLDRLVAVPVVVRCLLLFNAVFLVQNGLDATYLFGGAELPEGMTYARYAQRGAYPLVATALLAGAFVLWTFRAGGAAERSPLARRLVHLWLAQNLFLLLSAAWRLRLYVDAYSLTMWRVAAAVWMLLVALGLLWIVVRLLSGRSNAWLLRANLATLIAVLYACSFVDFAGGIAWFNATRSREAGGPGVPIDVAYLESLGPPALPALLWLEPRVDDAGVRPALDAAEARLRAELDRQLADWRGWTWKRAAVAELVSSRSDVAGR